MTKITSTNKRLYEEKKKKRFHHIFPLESFNCHASYSNYIDECFMCFVHIFLFLAVYFCV